MIIGQKNGPARVPQGARPPEGGGREPWDGGAVDSVGGGRPGSGVNRRRHRTLCPCVLFHRHLIF